MTERAQALIDELKIVAAKHDSDVHTTLHDMRRNYKNVHLRVKTNGVVKRIDFPAVMHPGEVSISQGAVELEEFGDELLTSDRFVIQDEVPANKRE